MIEILDSEVRLITPIDPEGFDNEAETPPDQNQRYFQLTHDYLVHSLRDWLTQKQKETRRGRAYLLLKDRASLWQAKPENRYLPSLGETARIRLLTDKHRWSPVEQAVVKKATAVHASRTAMALAALANLAAVGVGLFGRVVDSQDRSKAQALVEGLTKSDIGEVQAILFKLAPLQKWARPILDSKMNHSTATDSERLRVALALPADKEQQEFLVHRLCNLRIDEFPVVRDFISGSPEVVEYLWGVVSDRQQEANRRFQACCALATYSSDDDRWDEAAPFTAEYLINAVPSLHLAARLEQLQGARDRLVPALFEAMSRNEPGDESRRERAALALAQYVEGDPAKIIDAILLGDRHAEFDPLIESLKRSDLATAKAYLNHVLAAETMVSAELNDREYFLRRRAIAGATLAHLGELSDVVPLLVHSRDPSLRSFIAHFFAEIPVHEDALIRTADDDTLDVSVLRILVQAVGSLDPRLLPSAKRDELTAWLTDVHRENLDGGVHSMSGWALRQWGVDTEQLLTAGYSLDDRSVLVAEMAKQVDEIEDQLEVAMEGRAGRQRAWESGIVDKPDRSTSLDSNLLLRLKFDENKSIKVTGSGEPGSIQLDEQREFAPCIFGDAALLSENNSIDCGDIGNLDCTEAFSYGCWFNDMGRWQFGGMFSKMDASEGFRGFDLWQHGGQVAMHLVNREPDNYLKVLTAAKLPAGKWHHVLATYDGSMKAAGVRLFVNGEPADVVVESDTLTGTIETSAPLMIGTRYGQYPFTGWVDDVRLYDRVLSAEEAKRPDDDRSASRNDGRVGLRFCGQCA